MDIIVQKYKILFNLQLVLESFEGDLNQYFSVQPDEASEAVLAHYQTLSKKQKSAATFLIRTEHAGPADGEPWVSIDDTDKFLLQVKMKENSFLPNTHLAAYDLDNQVLFITNATVNMTGNELLLSKKLESYASANTYEKGFLVKSGTTNYKALQPSSPADAHGVLETDYWKPITQIGISQADLVDRSSLAELVDLSTILLIEIDSSSSLNNNYRLLNASDKVREVNYIIRFQSSN